MDLISFVVKIFIIFLIQKKYLKKKKLTQKNNFPKYFPKSAFIRKLQSEMMQKVTNKVSI